MFPIRKEIRNKLYFLTMNSIGYDMRRRQFNSTLSIQCERCNIRDKNESCKPRFFYIDFRLLGRLLGNAGGAGGQQAGRGARGC